MLPTRYLEIAEAPAEHCAGRPTGSRDSIANEVARILGVGRPAAESAVGGQQCDPLRRTRVTPSSAVAGGRRTGHGQPAHYRKVDVVLESPQKAKTAQACTEFRTGRLTLDLCVGNGAALRVP